MDNFIYLAGFFTNRFSKRNLISQSGYDMEYNFVLGIYPLYSPMITIALVAAEDMARQVPLNQLFPQPPVTHRNLVSQGKRYQWKALVGKSLLDKSQPLNLLCFLICKILIISFL